MEICSILENKCPENRLKSCEKCPLYIVYNDFKIKSVSINNSKVIQCKQPYTCTDCPYEDTNKCRMEM
jgi:hypothetical protein